VLIVAVVELDELFKTSTRACDLPPAFHMSDDSFGLIKSLVTNFFLSGIIHRYYYGMIWAHSIMALAAGIYVTA
jgi:hypothetical protein